MLKFLDKTKNFSIFFLKNCGLGNDFAEILYT